MNKLTQLGVSVGLAAGISLLPAEAQAVEQQHVKPSQRTENCAVGTGPFAMANAIGSQMCQLGGVINDIITPEPPTLSQSVELTGGEAGHSSDDYIGPLALLGLAGVITGGGYYQIRNASSDGMFHEANKLRVMRTDVFNLELEEVILADQHRGEK